MHCLAFFCLLFCPFELWHHYFVLIDKLVEEFTWLKELCHMWDIPIKSAGLAMHYNNYIDDNTLIIEHLA